MMYDCIIIGAGAAGLMCAGIASQRGRHVLVLEHGKKIAQKIRISGGGKCNFTNLYTSPANYISRNPRFCISALSRYSQHDFIACVKRYNIAYHEKTLGQLFCDGSAQHITDMLLSECVKPLVDIITQAKITHIAKTDTGFSVHYNDTVVDATSLVIATGGPSIPTMGATGFAYDIARQFGVNIITPEPALVPFTLPESDLNDTKALAGVSVDVQAECRNTCFREHMLFTHRGLSGPSILQISSYWQSGDTIEFDLLPAQSAETLLKTAREISPKQEVATILAQLLPKRLAQYIILRHAVSGNMADQSNAAIARIAQALHHFTFTPNGTEGFRTAEVTRGGIDTAALSSKTMQVRHVDGLYFIGEAVDVTGHLGGHNFQWAWSSGYACGQYC